MKAFGKKRFLGEILILLSIAGSVAYLTSPSTSDRRSARREPKAELNLSELGAKHISAKHSLKLPEATKKKATDLTAGFDLAKDSQNRLTVYNRSKASPGFTLFPVDGSAQILLLNMRGEQVHKWNIDVSRARMLPNCNLLVVHGSKWGSRVSPWKSMRHKITEYDWDGNVVWEYRAPFTAHHDVRRLENGNTLLLHRTLVPDDLKNRYVTDPFRRNSPIRSDVILEINPNQDVVWSWNLHEHIDLNSCGRQRCEENNKTARLGKARIDWTHVNTLSIIPDNKWFNAGHTQFKPGNIMFLPRNFWTAYILDRDTNEIVWSYGGNYKGGMIRGHEVHMISEGLPGAGNVLIFDNGKDGVREESYVLEINPVSKETVWTYDVGPQFYSNASGSIQRFSNGNTLIAEDLTGRAFEVTSDKEIVWEYHLGERTGRPHRYDFDHCPKFTELEKGLPETS